MQKRKVGFLLCLLFMIGATASAQGLRTISGVVNDETGTPISGVSISNPSGGGSGSKAIGITAPTGRFSVNVPDGVSALKFSSIGHADTIISISGSSSLTVVLRTVAAIAGSDVVVTALGVQKQSRDLSYVAQTVSNADLTTVKDGNFSNSLSGKAANVTITQGSGGAGSATNIILRGNNSLSGDGAPLIVIDGIPVVNENTRPSTGQGQFGQNFLAPDQLSTINPSDVEDVTILKGATAAALYGSQAANGAILITTKSGKNGQARVNASTNTTFLSAEYKPKLQTEYGGATVDNGLYSWGDETSNAAYAGSFYKDLLQTGLNTSNSVDITTGSENAQVYVAYANTYAKGVIPNNSMNRNNFDLKGTSNLFNKFIEFTGKFSYVNQTIHNPYAPGSYLNPYYSLMTLPADMNMPYYKNNYAADTSPYQIWPALLVSGDMDNPYWDINKVPTTDNLNRMILSGSLKFNFAKWLNLTLRGNSDQSNEDFMNEMYMGTAPDLASTTGGFQHTTTKTVQNYGDAILNFNKDLVKDVLHLTALAGGAIRDYKQTGLNINTNRIDIFQPNVFTTANVDFGGGAIAQDIYDRKQIQSLFYSFDFGYKNALFLTTTGRNDWSSTLPVDKNNYFYPSVGLSAVLTDLFKGLQSSTMNYLKVRASYTEVGNDLPTFIVNPTSTISTNGAISTPTTIIMPGTTLKPEMTTSFEAGFDANFFKNLVKLNATYYKSNTHDQLFTVGAPPSSGYSYYYVNGGNIQNSGVEVSVAVSPDLGLVKWTSTVNFSKNINRVKSLIPQTGFLLYSQLNNSNSYLQEILPGGSLGDFYAKKFQRDASGNYVLSSYYIDGVQQNSLIPQVEAQAEKVGNAFPNFLLSWGNQFNYKGFQLSFLVDGHFGGQVISMTQALLDYAGNSAQTAQARDLGYVMVNGQQETDVKGFYQAKGGIGGALGEYVYSATAIRLRELSLLYNLPATLVAKTKYIKGASIGLVGRNLFFFHKAAPIDPEIVSNNTQGQDAYLGLEMYNLPTNRSLGFSVNLNF